MAAPTPSKTPKVSSSASGLLREQLLFVGWVDGDPIPPNLPEKLAALKQEAIADLETELADNPAPAVRKQLDALLKSKFVKITDLPPMQQLAAREFVEASIEAIKTSQISRKKNAALDAQIPAVIQGEEREKIKAIAMRGDHESSGDTSDSVFIDDRKSADDTPATSVFCPCCSWDVAKPFDVDITTRDKEAFVVSLLGSQRFERAFPIFNSKASIVFRTINADEIQMLREELMYRASTSAIVSDAAYVAAWLEGRLVMSVKEITINGTPQMVLQDITTWAKANPQSSTAVQEVTPITRYTAYFFSKVTQEPLRNLLAAKHKLFDRIVETMLLKVDDPNFYSGIEPRA